MKIIYHNILWHYDYVAQHSGSFDVLILLRTYQCFFCDSTDVNVTVKCRRLFYNVSLRQLGLNYHFFILYYAKKAAQKVKSVVQITSFDR